jgi:aminopeptidase YwaD
MSKRWTILVWATMGLAVAQAQQARPQQWTVKPEWVRAHEEFLASDAMSGRGSATHDEEITANYVASEFIAYGLKTAPGMSSYIQSAEIISPALDGHATLIVGGVTLVEGKDFDLLSSSGNPVAGPLVRIKHADARSAAVPAGATVLLSGVSTTDDALADITAMRRKGAALVLLVQSPGTENLMGMMGGKTRTPIHLAEQPSRGGSNFALIHADAAARLTAPDGETVSLSVKTLTATTPRKTYNAIGYLPGSDPASGTILLSAHLDHLGIGRPVNGDAIYNGANDDAAGTTAVIELAHALASGPKLKRNVLFVCYGSEELGGLGSTYFGIHPPLPLKDLVTNLEFEMIGTQDPKMPKGVLLLTGWERSNFGPTLKAHGALLGPDPYPDQHFFERSDNYSLALQGVVAHTAAGWGTPPTYHQPNDDLAHLDIAFMTSAIQSLIEPMRWLASTDFRPSWNPGGKPERGK